jgi:hypothetical protein
LYYIYILLLVVIVILGAELLFRRASLRKHGKYYQPVGKAKYSDYFNKYKPYPYLPYLLKPKESQNSSGKPDFRKFAPKNSIIKEFSVNEFGVYDVCNPRSFERDFSKKMILLLGSSVLEGIIWRDNKPFQISSVLQEKLNARCPNEYQVVSIALAGWLSSEIMVFFLLKLISFKPDIVLYYHGANDVLASVSDNFKEDYSHYRRSISEIKNQVSIKLLLSSLFPYLDFFTLYEFILRKWGLRFHPQYELSKLLRPNQPNAENFQNLERNLAVEQRNIENIIACAKNINSKLILVSYVFWQYDSNSKWQSIQKYGVELENRNLREVATKHDVVFLDFAKAHDYNQEILLDEQHFNYDGINLFTDLVLKGIINGEN